MKRIFITGGTGFLGQEVVRLLSKQYKLKVLTRKNVNSKNVEYVKGDILDKESFRKYVEEADIIIHIAGLSSGNSRKIWKTNVEGTKNILNLVGNKKFIFISSETVLYKNQGVYGESKRVCEKLVRKVKNHLILRVALAYGKKDKNRLGKIIEICKNNSFIILPGNGKSLMQPIYTEDIAQYIFNGIKKNSKGTYILAGKSKISMNNFIDILGNILDKKIIKIHIPLFLVYPFVKLNEILLRNPLIRWSQIKNLNTNRTYDIEDIIKELKHTPLDIEKGLIKIIN